MKARKIFSAVLGVVALLATQATAANLVGKWDFEGGDDATRKSNKVPGITWNIYIPSTHNSPTFANGKCMCAVYDKGDGTFETQAAHADLQTDLSDFRSHTIVLWLKLDKLGNDTNYAHIFRLGGPGGSMNEIMSWQQGPTGTGQRQFDWRSGSEWIKPYASAQGPAITAGKLIKLAVVVDSTTDYEKLTCYYDNFDGSGLRPYGDPQWIMDVVNGIHNLGNVGDEVWFFPGVQSLAGDTIGVTFEEARVYDDVMTQSEIAPITYEGQPKLVGQWTFDWKNNTSPFDNKAPGYTWNTMSQLNAGANTVMLQDGAVKLTRWQNGSTWTQPGLSARLGADLGAGNYFQEMTQVIWLKWSDTDSGHSEWLTQMVKESAAPLPQARTEETIWFQNNATYPNSNWQERSTGEYDNSGTLAQAGNTGTFGQTANPPANQLVKVAYVIKADAASPGNFLSYVYADFNDGQGLRTIGSPQRIWWSQINGFGQSGTACPILPAQDPAPHYDFFKILAYCPGVPAKAGSITIEEARLYAGALDTSMLTDLSYDPKPAPTVIGRWTFDNYGTTGPLENKASGISWTPLTLNGTGATVAEGKLKLPRTAAGGGWTQSWATTKLQTDLGAGNYTKERTYLTWVKWENFALDDALQFAAFGKKDGTTNRGSLQCNWWAANGWNTRWEYMDGSCAFQSGAFGNLGSTAAPPTDRYIKLAWVLSQKDASNYLLKVYWDTGSGVVEVTPTGTTIAANQVPWFGQYNSADPNGCSGTRTDDLSIMGYRWAGSQGTGSIYFDEIQLYKGAMSTSEIASATAAAGAATGTGSLVGLWDFEGSNPLDNKVAGVTWDPLAFVFSTGHSVANGKLQLDRVWDPVWNQYTQNGARARLRTDFGSTTGYYFKGFTHVAWIKPSDVNQGTSIFMTTLDKWSNNGQKAYQTLWYRNNDAWPLGQWIARWQSEAVSGGSPVLGTTANMPANKLVKIAYSVYLNPTQGGGYAGSYLAQAYVDLNDGQGLQPIGGPQVVWSIQTDWWGQAGTPGFVGTDTTPHYDWFRIFDWSQTTPQVEGNIQVEEMRLYADGLSQQQIADLKYNGEPTAANPVIGTTNKAVLDQVTKDSAAKYDWVLWGKVTYINDDQFSIDDGSGVNITVAAPGHGLAGGEYVRVKGSLNAGATPPVLTATDIQLRQ